MRWAYMHYIDAMARQGKAADRQGRSIAVLRPVWKDRRQERRGDPATDKTLSPFC